MYQSIPKANRLLLADPSSANNSTQGLTTCNNCYTADGWGDIGTFTIGGLLTAGNFQAGSNCMDPVHLDAHFYDTNSCLNNSYIYKQLSFVKNTIQDNQQTITLPNAYWFSDTVSSGGVDVPNTSYHDYWVYWLPESDIERGEWIAVDDKCILMDNEAENRTLCGETYQTCFGSCGNNDLCKQTCADDHSACIVGNLTWMSPPSPPRTTYVDITGKAEYISPEPEGSYQYVHIDSAGHAEFDRPDSPVYAVVNFLGHPELDSPAIPNEVTVDLRAAGSLAVPSEYDRGLDR